MQSSKVGYLMVERETERDKTCQTDRDINKRQAEPNKKFTRIPCFLRCWLWYLTLKEIKTIVIYDRPFFLLRKTLFRLCTLTWTHNSSNITLRQMDHNCILVISCIPAFTAMPNAIILAFGIKINHLFYINTVNIAPGEEERTLKRRALLCFH